jgi:hypothetical protein
VLRQRAATFRAEPRQHIEDARRQKLLARRRHLQDTKRRVLSRLQDQFYIICPDNDVTADVDNRRILWGAEDIIRNRPPLSRWHPDYAEEFAAFLASPSPFRQS